MKIRILPVIAAALMFAGSFLSSCLKNDYEEIDMPSASSIQSFSLGTLNQTVYGKDSKGNDSVYVDTVSYAKIPFIIDQLNRKIYNEERVPHTVDLKKALIRVSSDTEVIYFNYQTDPLKNDSIWTPNDSLDLTRGLELKVMTYSPTTKTFRLGKPYYVTVNAYKSNPDSLVWKHFEDTKFNSDLTDLTEQKAVFADNSIYVFGKDANGNKIYKTTVNNGEAGDWEDITASNVNNFTVNSALAFDNNIYYVGGNKLYNLNNNSPLGSISNLSTLISVANDSILAYTTDSKLVSISKDGNAGTKTAESEYNFSGSFFAVSETAEHNNKLWRTTVLSHNIGTEEADTTANVYTYISNGNILTEFTPNNPVTCPNLENISMIKYDGKLYAFGGKYGDKVKAFDKFYFSNNNGYDWRIEQNEYMKFEPRVAELYGDKPYSCVIGTDSQGKENYIWFIWHDGKISRANLNKFGPENNSNN